MNKPTQDLMSSFLADSVCRETYILAVAERDKLKAQRDALLAAAKGIVGLLDKGMLVRDTSHDHEPDWAIKQFPLVRNLVSLRAAIEEAEK